MAAETSKNGGERTFYGARRKPIMRDEGRGVFSLSESRCDRAERQTLVSL